MNNEYITNKYFKLINNNNINKCIDVINNEQLIITPIHNGMHQNWYYDTQTKQIVHLLSKKVIEFFNETIILSKSVIKSKSQKWEFLNNKLRCILNDKYLTLNTKDNSLFLHESEKIDTQIWNIKYIKINLKTLNNIESKYLEDKINENKKTLEPGHKTLKIEEKNDIVKISIHKQPHIINKLSIQAWIKVKKFTRTETFKPLYYLNDKIGLWLMPYSLTLYTHKDFKIDYKLKINEWINITQIYNFDKNSYKFFINNKIIFNIRMHDITDKKIQHKFDPNIFTIINNEDIKVGTLFYSNFELDNAIMTERYNNSLYNENNNIYTHELKEIQDNYKKLQQKYDLLKYSKCPPAQKCIKEPQLNNNLYVLKSDANKKYEELMKELSNQKKLNYEQSNNTELEIKHKMINYKNKIKELETEMQNYKHNLNNCKSNFVF